MIEDQDTLVEVVKVDKKDLARITMLEDCMIRYGLGTSLADLAREYNYQEKSLREMLSRYDEDLYRQAVTDAKAARLNMRVARLEGTLGAIHARMHEIATDKEKLATLTIKELVSLEAAAGKRLALAKGDDTDRIGIQPYNIVKFGDEDIGEEPDGP